MASDSIYFFVAYLEETNKRTHMPPSCVQLQHDVSAGTVSILDVDSRECVTVRPHAEMMLPSSRPVSLLLPTIIQIGYRAIAHNARIEIQICDLTAFKICGGLVEEWYRQGWATAAAGRLPMPDQWSLLRQVCQSDLIVFKCFSTRSKKH